MNRRFWIMGAAALFLSGCGAAVGVGSGVDNLASTNVKTGSTDAVRKAVLDVFGAEGFQVRSQTPQSITFTKRGGRSADIAWKTIGNSNPVMIRPTVTWRPNGTSEVWVGCQVQVAQASSVFGETVREPLAAGKSAYNGLLRKVKKQAEAGR